jgi:nucleotide-binding universal stress UspA family protein
MGADVYRDRIVVGVDGSSGSRSALMWAVDECQIRRRTLLIVHAPDLADAPFVRSSGEPAIRALDGAGLRLLDAHSVAASTRQPGVPVTSLLSHSSPADALVDLSLDADMLVVGTRGHSGFTSTVLGSVSTRTAAHAHCPVVVVPQSPALRVAESPLPIVVGAANTPAGRLAFEFALAEAQRRNSAVIALMSATRDTDGPAESGAVLPTDLKRIGELYPDVRLVTSVVDAEPAEALLVAARNAQLVVLGCHHSDDRWSTRLGPVAATVLHQSPCPVVVVGARRHTASSPMRTQLVVTR